MLIFLEIIFLNLSCSKLLKDLSIISISKCWNFLISISVSFAKFSRLIKISFIDFVKINFEYSLCSIDFFAKLINCSKLNSNEFFLNILLILLIFFLSNLNLFLFFKNGSFDSFEK